jgi:hypothetical protein
MMMSASHIIPFAVKEFLKFEKLVEADFLKRNQILDLAPSFLERPFQKAGIWLQAFQKAGFGSKPFETGARCFLKSIPLSLRVA